MIGGYFNFIDSAMTTEENRLFRISEVFSPSAPIERRSLFYGRTEQIEKIIGAMFEKGQHAVLFGERGVGKTSLANIIMEILANGVVCSKVTCSKKETYKTLWAKALRKIQFQTINRGIGFTATEYTDTRSLSASLPTSDDIDSIDIQNILEHLRSNLLFIFDEFDSIEDKDTIVRFSETIKLFSDNVTNVTILLIGVAENVSDLLENHQSVERCLVQIKMPRMSHSELKEIISRGLSSLSISISENLSNKIIEYSSGFPHYTHLLCKHGAESVINREDFVFTKVDLDYAVNKAIDNSNQQLRDSYQKATVASKTKNRWSEMIRAASQSSCDEYDSFTANDVLAVFLKQGINSISRESITYYLGQFCKSERGVALEQLGYSKNVRYRFKNPLMKNYIKLKTHREDGQAKK